MRKNYESAPYQTLALIDTGKKLIGGQMVGSGNLTLVRKCFHGKTDSVTVTITMQRRCENVYVLIAELFYQYKFPKRTRERLAGGFLMT